MIIPSSTSSISQASISRTSIRPSSESRVLGESTAEVQKAGFYMRDSSFLIDEGLNFITTEAGFKFVLDIEGKRTVDGGSTIIEKENIR
jgi:hypothetical protein